MNDNQERAIAWVIKKEVNPGEEETGAYHCEPGDRGGCTKFGIAQKWHPNINVEFLTRKQAIEIYAAEYWQPIGGDALPTGVDLVVLDLAVTSSPGRALKVLQAVSVGGPSANLLISFYSEARRKFYVAIALKDPTQEKFLRDWIKRANQTEIEAKKWRGIEPTAL